jgi:peptidoglycan-N-acetylglucosamine deacetylase
MQKIKSVLFFMLVVTLCLISFSPLTSAQESTTVKITTADTDFFDDTLQQKLFLLSKNSIVIVLSEENGWAKVNYKSTIGYIQSKDLKPAVGQYMIVKSKVEPLVRVTDTQHSETIGNLSISSIVEVFDVKSPLFVFVRSENLTGYIYKNTLGKPLEEVRVVKEQKGVTVYSASSTSSKQIGHLAVNSKVTMLAKYNGWVFVQTSELSGYVLGNGLKYDTKPSKESIKKPTTPKPSVSGSKKIALTFDDGPNAKVTPQILNTLKKYNAKATFFVVGEAVKKHPTVLKEVFNAGHEIGNHTYNHAKLTTLTVKQMSLQIQSADSVIQAAIGQNPTVFRPPYGAYDKTVTNQLKVPNVLWSIDTLDWKHHDPKKTFQAVKDNAKPGSIVLMHDIHQATANALDDILAMLQKQGYEFVTVTELLNSK